MAFDAAGSSAETISLWSLAEDSLVEFGDDTSLVVVTRWGEFDFPDAGPLVREALRRMALGPVSLANVADSWDEGEDRARADSLSWTVPGAVALNRVLTALSGSVVRSLGLNDGKGPLLSVVPVVPEPVFVPAEIAATRPVRLSRFGALRPGDGGLWLVSPSAPFRVLLAQPWAVRVAASLGKATTAAEIAAREEIPAEVARPLVGYLVASGCVVAGDDGGRFAEDADPGLNLWSYEELLFHDRSRTWQANGLPETAEPPRSPVAKPQGPGPEIVLHRPDLADRAALDPSLTELLETDHAAPAFTTRELSAEQIGEFLYRAARIRSSGPASLPDGTAGEVSQRPYVSMARLYELELYLTVNRCSGLPQGIYHYDPAGHRLVLVSADAVDRAVLLDMAMVAAANHRRPAALLSVTTRMARTAPVLGSRAYAAALLHLGALQETLYLTAKAMGLAAHAVSVDAGDRVGRALRLDWPAEVCVGECALDLAP
ncbi:SagB family peptide dehydrogenase [Amycolatopsis sp. NPDC051128]|uniref:SagB family peptide dehydrogenase n=1 Tax=Amycolatopsis sp. NPDC051128 TaxID=3155412 RepID=UPI0034205EA1